MMLTHIAFDQFGQHYFLTSGHPRKELCKILNRKHVDRMYIDDKDGNVYRVGYIIAGYWLTVYSVEGTKAFRKLVSRAFHQLELGED